jgi:hypothetical protein
MKRFISGSTFLALVVSSAMLVASAPEKYGKELTLKETTPVAEILASPEKYKGKLVQVEGTVTDVCSKMGCWIKIDAGEGIEPITFKVDDGVMVFPVEAKGKKARAEGVVDVQTMTEQERIAQAKHEAEENDRLDSFDPSSIKGDKTVVRIMGEGAVISD